MVSVSHYQSSSGSNGTGLTRRGGGWVEWGGDLYGRPRAWSPEFIWLDRMHHDVKAHPEAFGMAKEKER